MKTGLTKVRLTPHREPTQMKAHPVTSRCQGQALIESSLALAFICLFIFGLLQVARLYASREVLIHASTAAARSRTVGFNDFMVYKVFRVASIPNAGLMNAPGYTGYANPNRWRNDTPGQLWDSTVRSGAQPSSAQFDVERSRIPLYLGAQHHGQLSPIPDYENWDNIHLTGLTESGDNTLTATLTQDVPATLPFRAAFYAEDYVRMRAQSRMDLHYPLYLE